jgi:hypothetical protein
MNAGERRNICHGLPVSSTNQGSGPAVHVVADKPVSAVQIEDGDGTDQTAFYPTSLLNTRYGIPKGAQYLAINCPRRNTSVTLYRPNGRPLTRNCSAQGNRPGKVYFGRSTSNRVLIPQGSYVESNNPIFAIYEVTGSEDEHNLMGASN